MRIRRGSLTRLAIKSSINKTEEKIIYKQKRSKIEVNLDFDSMKKMPSKRTILSKNKGSTKSFNSMMVKENDQIISKLNEILII